MTLKSRNLDAQSSTSTLKLSENVEVTSNIKWSHSVVNKGMKHCIKDYCNNTSIHGLRYLTEEGRTLTERICWLIAFVLSVAASAHLISEIWQKWDQRPVIVSFAEQSTPLYQIPFPAITLCSETKAKRNTANYTELTRKFENNETMDDNEMMLLSQMSLLCEFSLLELGDKIINNSVIHFFKEVGPDFDEEILLVKWKSKFQNETELFSPILTDEGICYTFNMLDGSEMFTNAYQNEGDFLNHGVASPDWSLDDGYTPGAGVEAYPNRALGAGNKAGITIVLTGYSEDFDHVCMGPIQGYKVLLHNPAEIPQVREQYLRVPLNQEVVVRVIPNMMTTSKGLRDYAPNRRQCYFPSERQLRFFKVYTQSNCDLECLTNFTMKMCGCVAFYMPRDSSMPICGSGSLDCILNASSLLLAQGVQQGVEENDYSSNCHCLQACTELFYDGEISSANFDWRLLPWAEEALNITPGMNIARLTISFKDAQFITSRRNELYGRTDFLANCGGILGLCLGFSVLSLVEIVYHFTLRIWCVYTRKKAEEQSHVL